MEDLICDILNDAIPVEYAGWRLIGSKDGGGTCHYRQPPYLYEGWVLMHA